MTLSGAPLVEAIVRLATPLDPPARDSGKHFRVCLAHKAEAIQLSLEKRVRFRVQNS